jgi:hypothetical protein
MLGPALGTGTGTGTGLVGLSHFLRQAGFR